MPKPQPTDTEADESLAAAEAVAHLLRERDLCPSQALDALAAVLAGTLWLVADSAEVPDILEEFGARVCRLIELMDEGPVH